MEDFLVRMKSLLGGEYDSFLKYYEADHFRGLRVNTLKCTPERLKDIIGFELKPTPFCPNGFYIPGEVRSLGNSPLHHCGAFYIQEPSATSAAEMLGVEEGDFVLDLCAAPGGKSTQIGAMLNGTGLLWSNEIVRNRANILLSNIERMGISNAVVSNAHPEQLCERLAGRFDKVLVDAPCSGEGMFRKNGEAQTEWSVEHVRSCAERQLHILDSAKKALRPGGVLVYSTCTFSREENEGVISRFLDKNPDFVLEDPGVSFGRPTMEHARRIFPMDGGEGHFAARLRKKGESGRISVPVNTSKADSAILDFYDSLFVNRPFGENITVLKDKIIILPKNYQPADGVPVLRAGVILGEIVKRRFEPHHSAFAAAKKSDCVSAVDFDADSAQIKAYLHGEEIAVPSDVKGYCAVCVDGMTVGFGKASNGRLKNKYPKGLRTLK
ncbi:RsmB/NOP family class I SAM-dependent RNA methyltransferase [Ruminococcus sp.]|uniref:RsmB/NOP family class I SAM-dependent RNA methyltransferase n=1 Tax=Ruminococcus sp. TaxID=41978 RepID=UPI002E76284C|nr:RsmB/NOP family class I SAM-dependent RNA methyltransferase [Ruminococcus sp.]MEE1262852.1 RsmB/NOP family class I SAM-dependent RNA methyltransferase [Ruminococcus sp.]